jgi:hypothetical protein
MTEKQRKAIIELSKLVESIQEDWVIYSDHILLKYSLKQYSQFTDTVALTDYINESVSNIKREVIKRVNAAIADHISGEFYPCQTGMNS